MWLMLTSSVSPDRADTTVANPERRPGGGNKDVFAGYDRGFSRHKSAMRKKFRNASATLCRNDQHAGFIIVQMRNEQGLE